MILCRLAAFYRILSKGCLTLGLALAGPGGSVVQAERILDLDFWPADQSSLALGGLWEFHAQTLLEPAQRRWGSELLLEISQPWRDYRPLQAQEPLERGSYVLLVRGFMPRPQGYALQLVSPDSMTKLIVAPKYAPGQAHRIQTEGVFAVFPWLRSLLSPRLQLVFHPKALDEVWMIIVQRWQMSPDAAGSVPLVKLAQGMDERGGS
jgi:hypothetical protein